MSDDPTAKAASRARRRAQAAEAEPSLARRFGQIGVLGWMIVAPMLAGLALGIKLDALLATHITFAAAFLVAGAALGLWLAFRWMTRQ